MLPCSYRFIQHDAACVEDDKQKYNSMQSKLSCTTMSERSRGNRRRKCVVGEGIVVTEEGILALLHIAASLRYHYDGDWTGGSADGAVLL